MIEPPALSADRNDASRWARAGFVRVPQITAAFWVIKALTTALGESTSDWSVHATAPAVAVVLGFLGFLITLGIQLRRRAYVPWAYWLAVAGVGVFGTMAADVLHVGLGVPYIASSVLYAVSLGAVFLAWRGVEHTLSIHDVNSTRRQLFYWAAVVATFALGTAVGDLSAITLHLGYFASIWLFAGLMLLPALGYWGLGLSPILTFWAAYILTRPLGASVADWLGKPGSAGGLGLGGGVVAGALALMIAALVTFVSLRPQRPELVAESAGA
ncbi:MAG: hypothetical protein JWN31_154 [Frankiales bacterium]|nr:hypothetical protein [Frankiales bacterium]